MPDLTAMYDSLQMKREQLAFAAIEYVDTLTATPIKSFISQEQAWSKLENLVHAVKRMHKEWEETPDSGVHVPTLAPIDCISGE